MKMGALIYLKDIVVTNRWSGRWQGYSYSCDVMIALNLVGTQKDAEKFVEFSRTTLLTILKNYTMDWHVKPDNPEHIEFILNIMGDIMKLQQEGKIIEAKALLELVERVLPTYKDSEQYQLAEDLRNVIWDQIMLEKEK